MRRIDREFNWIRENVGPVRKAGRSWQFACPKCGGGIGRSAHAYQVGGGSAAGLRVSCYQPGCCWNKNSVKKGLSVVAVISDLNGVDVAGAYNTLKNQRIKTTLNVDPVKIIAKSAIRLPKGYLPLDLGNTPIAKKARQYMIGRGYDIAKIVSDHGIGYINAQSTTNENYGYLVFPFKSREGVLQYYQLRSFIETSDKNRLRWKNPDSEGNIGKSSILWNEQALVCEPEELLAMEGITDCLTVERAVGTLGLVTSPSQHYKLSQRRAKKLVYALDEGAWVDTLVSAKDQLDYEDGGQIYVSYFEKGEDDANTLGKQSALSIINARKFRLTFSNFLDEMSRVTVVRGKTYREGIKQITWI